MKRKPYTITTTSLHALARCKTSFISSELFVLQTPHEQYQYRHGYQFSIPGGTQYQDAMKMAVVPPNQPVPHHDYTQRMRGPIQSDEFLTTVHSEGITTQNHQPTYYPIPAIGQQRDQNAENSGLQNKLLGLANALARNPKPDMRSLDQVTSSSEVRPEICAPPKTPAPQSTPCTSQPQPTPCSSQSQPTSRSSQPQTAPCAPQPNPESSPCSQPSAAPCSSPKFEIVTPAPKIIPARNPFLPEQNPLELSKSTVVRASSLHSSSKFSEESSEAPCDSFPPAAPTKKECEPEQEKKRIFPLIIPAERPIVCNPFSDSQQRVIPHSNQKGILHHRLHPDEHLEYPEGYVSRPEGHVKPVHVPYMVTYPGQYQTAGTGKHVGYAFVPVPRTKPIPLVVPPEREIEEGCDDDENDVVYHQERSSRRYENDKDWSKHVLRDIADKLGAILDEESFRSDRRSSRPERWYSDERYEDQGYSPRNYARSDGDYYEQNYDDDRWKERKYSRRITY